jgi:hypothetical protein
MCGSTSVELHVESPAIPSWKDDYYPNRRESELQKRHTTNETGCAFFEYTMAEKICAKSGVRHWFVAVFWRSKNWQEPAQFWLVQRYSAQVAGSVIVGKLASCTGVGRAGITGEPFTGTAMTGPEGGAGAGEASVVEAMAKRERAERAYIAGGGI